MNPHWTTAVSVLGVGLLLGAASALVLGRATPVAVPAGKGRGERKRKAPVKAPRASASLPEDLTDLVARRDAALSRLRELTAAAPGPEKSAEQLRLEVEAAQAMRAIDAAKKRNSAAAQEPSGLERSVLAHRWLWGAASAAFAVVVVFGLRSFSTTRLDGSPMTGGQAAAMTSSVPHEEEGAPPDPAVVALQKRVEQEPDNLDLRLDLADAELRTTSGYFDAFQNAKIVLGRDSTNGRALLQQAVVRSAMGMHSVALQLAEKAVASHPTMVEAWIAQGREASVVGNKKEAVESYEKAMALQPNEAEMIKPWLAEARAASDAPEGAAGAPVVAAAPAPTEHVAGAIQGTVELDPALAATLSDGAFVFVMVKDESGSPMPIAAKRLPARGFPIEFSISQADAMMGRQLPASARLEARLDADGNASTRDPSDPVAQVEHVVPGTAGLKLVLRAPNRAQ